jgi:hypothetical protein
MAIGRLPLIAQAMIAALLIFALLASGRFSQATRLYSALALLVISIVAGTIALHHGLLLPILPAILTALCLCAMKSAVLSTLALKSEA